MRCHQQHLHMVEKPWLLLAQVFDDWKAFAAAAARGAGEGGAAQEPRLSNVTLAFLEACCRDEVTSVTPQTVFTWLSACALRRGGGLQACFATKCGQGNCKWPPPQLSQSVVTRACTAVRRGLSVGSSCACADAACLLSGTCTSVGVNGGWEQRPQKISGTLSFIAVTLLIAMEADSACDHAAPIRVARVRCVRGDEAAERAAAADAAGQAAQAEPPLCGRVAGKDLLQSHSA